MKRRETSPDILGVVFWRISHFALHVVLSLNITVHPVSLFQNTLNTQQNYSAYRSDRKNRLSADKFSLRLVSEFD
jgi:hypothetical protein